MHNPEYAELFAVNNPKQIIAAIRLMLNNEIRPGKAILFLDVGLVSTMLNVNWQVLQEDVMLVYEGGMAEQWVGQELLLNADLPSLLAGEHILADGKKKPYRLLSLPLYMAEQVRRLILRN